MSSSDDANLNLQDASGTETLNGITNFLQDGGKASTVLSASFIGLVVSPFVALADVIQAMGTFFSSPFESFGETFESLLEGIFKAPGDLLDDSADLTYTALETSFGETVAGILAFPIAIGIVMLSLYLVVQYLSEAETGDTLPGIPVDVPTDIFGVEEEETIDE